LDKIRNRILPKKYGIVEVFVLGEPQYLAIYKLKGNKWKAIDRGIPDIVNGLISAQDINLYKKRIYSHTLDYWDYWKLYESNNSTKISENAERYGMVKSRQDVED